MLVSRLLLRSLALSLAAMALAGCATPPPPIKLTAGGPGAYHVARVELVPPEGASEPMLQSHMRFALLTSDKPPAASGQPATLRLRFSKFSKGRVGALVGDVSLVDSSGRSVAEAKGVGASHQVGGSAGGAPAAGGLIGALAAGIAGGIMQGVAERNTDYERALSVAFTDQLSTRLFKPNGIGIRADVPVVLVHERTLSALSTAPAALHLGYYRDRAAADDFVKQFWAYRADVLRHYEPQIVAWRAPQGEEQQHIYAVPLGGADVNDGCGALKAGGAYCSVSAWRSAPKN